MSICLLITQCLFLLGIDQISYRVSVATFFLSFHLVLSLRGIVRLSNDLHSSPLLSLGIVVLDVRRWNRTDHRHEIHLQTRSDSLVGVLLLRLWISTTDRHSLHDPLVHRRLLQYLVRLEDAWKTLTKVKLTCLSFSCWLSHDYGFLWAFAIPFVLLICVSLSRQKVRLFN